MYDEDNIDLEEQMYLQDIEEEMNAEENEDEEVEEEETVFKYTINKAFIKNELNAMEPDRHLVKFMNNGKMYEGKVIAQIDKEKTVWTVRDASSNSGFRTAMFNLKNIKSV